MRTTSEHERAPAALLLTLFGLETCGFLFRWMLTTAA